MALTDKLTAIGDAIRSKTGGNSALSLTEMATAISNLSVGAPTLKYSYWVDNVTYNGSAQSFEIDVETHMNNGNDFTATTPFIIVMPWYPSAYGSGVSIGWSGASIIKFDGTNFTIEAAPWNTSPTSSYYTLAAQTPTFTNNLAVDGTFQLDRSNGAVGSSQGGSLVNMYFMFWGA